MASQTPQRYAFKAWQAHNEQPRALEPAVVAWKILEDLYPNHHITRTQEISSNLLGYAAAGFATANRDLSSGYDATRCYRASGSRTSEERHTLKDDVGFGCLNYKWNDTNFIVYEFSWLGPHSQKVSFLFVLADLSNSGLQDGRHPKTDALLLAAGKWTKELHDEIYVYDNEMWLKSKSLYKSVQGTTWDDVVLDASMKEAINNDVHGFFDNRQLYTDYGVAWKRGIIFHGSPGNGKSMCIKTLISTLFKRAEPVPSLYVKSLDSCRGSKWSIRNIFSLARSMAPCLLIFEDLDSLVVDKTRSYFLNEIDGLESNDGILMVGSTNHLNRLDSAVTKRPSRFDRKYRFDLPNEAERVAYCQYWKSKLTKTVSLDDEACELVAKITEGFSFAYLKELFVSTLLLLARSWTEESKDLIQDEEPVVKAGTSSNADEGTESRLSDDGVVLEKPTENDSTTDKKAEADNIQKPPTKAKHAVYSLEIPASQADNLMFKALIAQTKALCAQMDDSGNAAGEQRDKTSAEMPFGGTDFITSRFPGMAALSYGGFDV